jgi:hypothetical protein
MCYKFRVHNWKLLQTSEELEKRLGCGPAAHVIASNDTYHPMWSQSPCNDTFIRFHLDRQTGEQPRQFCRERALQIPELTQLRVT